MEFHEFAILFCKKRILLEKGNHFLFDNPVNLGEMSIYASVETSSGTTYLNDQNDHPGLAHGLPHGRLPPERPEAP